MYPACSCELEDHEPIKLAVSVLREVSFTAVGLQTSVPIAYMHYAGCLWAGKCLQACCSLGWYIPTLQAVFGLLNAFRQAVLSLWVCILYMDLCLASTDKLSCLFKWCLLWPC